MTDKKIDEKSDKTKIKIKIKVLYDHPRSKKRRGDDGPPKEKD